MIGRTSFTVALAAIVALWLSTSHAETGTESVLAGTVTRVVDGDTIDVLLSSGSIRVRLHGIDAPERKQPGGTEATRALTREIMNQTVQLLPISQDRYDRLVAVVLLRDINVNERLVRQGHAWAYRHYLRRMDTALCHSEAQARIERRGLWSAPTAVAPWDFRRRSTTASPDPVTHSEAECVAAIGKRG